MFGVSSTSPTTARLTQTKSLSLREVRTATPSGPMNSMATAIPSGIRAMAP